MTLIRHFPDFLLKPQGREGKGLISNHFTGGNCAHGYAHRDSYNLRGKHTKEKLYLTFEDALNLADNDIDDRWEVYKHRFLEGGLP